MIPMFLPVRREHKERKMWNSMQDPNFEENLKVSGKVDPASGSRLSPRDVARLQRVRSGVVLGSKTPLTSWFFAGVLRRGHRLSTTARSACLCCDAALLLSFLCSSPTSQ